MKQFYFGKCGRSSPTARVLRTSRERLACNADKRLIPQSDAYRCVGAIEAAVLIFACVDTVIDSIENNIGAITEAQFSVAELIRNAREPAYVWNGHGFRACDINRRGMIHNARRRRFAETGIGIIKARRLMMHARFVLSE